MIHAYDELYLGCARKGLAQMLDKAVFQYGMRLEDYYALFLVSSIAARFQRGDCSIIAGRSGTELVEMVLEETGAKTGGGMNRSARTSEEGKSREYWTGWALAYFQWYSAMSFEQIDRMIPIDEIRDMYLPYHEMDIRQFCDAMEARLAAGREEARLKFYRSRLGLSQRQLAEAAEVPIRTIQQYEQRQKNINKARAEYLVSLARVLYCAETDLLE